MARPKSYIKKPLVFEIVQLLKVKESEAGDLRVNLTKLKSNSLEVITKHLRKL